MENFDWMSIVWAALPIATGVLASLWLGFKAKALNDGVQDWKDEAVKAVDDFVAKLNEAEDESQQ